MLHNEITQPECLNGKNTRKDQKGGEDYEWDEELEQFIDFVIDSNFNQIKPEEVIKSLQEVIKTNDGRKGTNPVSQKPKKEFQLSGLILERMKVYDGLQDIHLKEFLAKRNRRQILIKTGLLNEEGYIIQNRSPQFIKNREQQRKANNKTNCKVTDADFKLADKSKVSPYYNNSWENKDKLYQKLYVGKPKKENEVQTRNAQNPVDKKSDKPSTKVASKSKEKANQNKTKSTSQNTTSKPQQIDAPTEKHEDGQHETADEKLREKRINENSLLSKKSHSKSQARAIESTQKSIKPGNCQNP